MKITVTKEPIQKSVTAIRKERLMWVKMLCDPSMPGQMATGQSFPVSIHFWEYNDGKKRNLMAIEVRGHYISKWDSVSSLWKEVASSIGYEINSIAKQILPENYCKKVVADIKGQIKTDKIHISACVGSED